MATPLLDSELADLRAQYPNLPEDYFAYLQSTGWGESPSGRVIYSGPVPIQDVYGEAYSSESIILLGDDMQGYCVGFDPQAKQLGEVSDSGDWEPWPSSESFSNYANAD